jgi:hypothetical protein
MERLRARQQAAHHDAIRQRVPAPILPTCAAQRLRPHSPLRISRQRPPHVSPRARPAATRLPASTKFTSRQLPAGHLAMPTLRSQHAYRAQPHRATTGVSMQTDRFLLTPAPSKDSRRCDRTSRPTCVSDAELPPYNPFLLACSSRNYSHVKIYLPRCIIQSGSSSLFTLRMKANSRT